MEVLFGDSVLREDKVRKVTINCSKTYEVLIEKGLINRAGELLFEKFGGKKACVITDDIVGGIYSERLSESLSKNNIEHMIFSFYHGESNKNLDTILKIQEFLAQNHFTRSDYIIALGGGIVGDVAGFAASIYLRGIEFVQIPTTVLSAVDSSAGGKTGVNLGGLKNQMGTFWQPSLVICDTEVFDTLPEAEYCGGMAEVIKYAAICDLQLGEILHIDFDIDEIIQRCIDIKGKIVEQDEHDNGNRQLLNLGHTFGHAIEKVSGNKISHGYAVAAGMVMAFKAAEMLGVCKKGELKTLLSLIRKFNLPDSFDFSVSDLSEAMLSDKKRFGQKINFVLPKKFGECILYGTEIENLEKILKMAATK